jgi:hypothetical protein
MRERTSVQLLGFALSAGAAVGLASTANAQGAASDLLAGQAPLIFTQGKDGGVLRDGTVATTDEVYLWVPALDGGNNVDLGTTGQFYKIWDSGSTNGNPNNVALGGNDDEDNEMRGLHFDPTGGGSFLISYDDTTTTGFAAGSFTDGSLLRVAPTGPFSSGGMMQDFAISAELIEGPNGTAGNFAASDLYGFAEASDGTFYWASSSATLDTTTGGTVSKASNAFAHTEGFSSPAGSPRNIGDTMLFDGNENPAGSTFPAFINGQGRGMEVLDDGTILVGVSDTYNYPNASDTGVDVVLDRWDIGSFDPTSFDVSALYEGELFFETIGTGTSEMLDFDIFDTQFELQAFYNMIGADSDAGLALAPFVVPAPGAVSIAAVALGLNLRRRKR